MEPLKVSAMFAAYVWFTECNKGVATVEKEAASFAWDNWQAFLPCAHKGLGRLLTRIASLHPRAEDVRSLGTPPSRGERGPEVFRGIRQVYSERDFNKWNRTASACTQR